MKIYRCKRCGTHTNRVDIEIPVWVSAKIDAEGNLHPGDSDFTPPWDYDPNEKYIVALDKVVSIDMDCVECSLDENNTLELIEVDECPHVWGRTRYMDYAATLPCRRCEICGIKQEGEIAW